MGLKRHIMRGLIEQYMIGRMTREEAIEFEKLLKESPDMQEELKVFESEIDLIVRPNIYEPPSEVWDLILKSLNRRTYEEIDDAISSYLQKKTVSGRKRKKCVSIAAFALLAVILLFSILCYSKYLNEKNEMKMTQYQKSNASK